MKVNDLNEKIAARVKNKVFSLATRSINVALDLPIVQEFYETNLLTQIRNGPIPVHIGVILDGNRRWARSKGLDPWQGHIEGSKKIEDFLDWCSEIDEIKVVTLYAFSTENFNRPQKEVREIFKLLTDYLTNLLEDKRIHKNEIRLKMLGRINMLPKSIQKLIKELEEGTAHYKKKYFNFAIAYGGRTEIVDAVRSIASRVKANKLALKDIDEEMIESSLYTSHLPDCSADMIIRTSGEVRLSNFMTWQGAYSELCFIDVYWPAFRKLDLFRAIRTYQKRQRRFGE